MEKEATQDFDLTKEQSPTSTENEPYRFGKEIEAGLSDDDPEIVDLAATLETYSTGNFTVDIVRKTPLFCSGFCGTFPVEGLSLDDIRASWGGERYQFRFVNAKGQIVARRKARIADIPRNNGVPIDPKTWNMFVNSMPQERDGATATPHVLPQAPQDNALLAVLRETLDRQTEMIDRLLQTREQPPRAFQPLGEMLDALTQLRDFSGAFAPQAQSEANPMFEMMKLLMESKEQNKQTAPPQRKIVVYRPRVAPAQAPAQPPVNPPQAPVNPPPPPLQNPSEPPEPEPAEDEKASIVEKFAALPVEEMAKSVGEIFENMDPEERQKAIAILMSSGSL